MQEPEDDSLGNERRELVLVVAAARDDDREVGELLVDLVDEVLRVVVGERGVDQQYCIARGHHEVGSVRRVVGAPDAMNACERVAQQVDERRIGREHDDVGAIRLRRRLARLLRRKRGVVQDGVLAGVMSRRVRGLGSARARRLLRIRCVIARLDVRVIDVHWLL